MTLWAFLLCIAYVPDWTGSVMPTGWAYLCLTLPFMVWGRQAFIPWWLVLLGVGALAYAIFSLWSLSVPVFGLERIMQLFALGMSAWFASTWTDEDFRAIIRGIAMGVGVTVFLAIIQHFGNIGVPSAAAPAGLMYSSIIMGDVCAVIFLAGNSWELRGVMLIGIALSGSRGAVVGLIVGLICKLSIRTRWGLLALVAPLGALGWMWFHISDSDGPRLVVWRNILLHLRWLGWGPGSLDNTILTYHGVHYVVQYAHNEFLDLIYTYGIGAGFLVLILLAPLTRIRQTGWPAYCAWFACALWAFPLHSPIEGFLGASLVGYICRRGVVLWPDRYSRGSTIPMGMGEAKPNLTPGRWGSRPLVAGHLQQEIR